MQKTCGEIPVNKILKGVILFSFCFSFPVSSKEGFLYKCYRNFRGKSDQVKYSFSAQAEWKSPYAKELFSSVYQQLPILEKEGWSSKEIQPFVSSIEELLHYIENSSDQTVKSRLELINSRLSSAFQAVPAIFSFVNSGKAEGYESLDVKGVLKLVLATLSYHTMAYLKHPHVNKLDWGRLAVILKSISDFKMKPNVFSLYKIQITVREKYSPEEYINCY